MKKSLLKYLAWSLILLSALMLSDCKKPVRVTKISSLNVESENISYSEVLLKGEIIDIGEETADDHGFLISKNKNPDETNSDRHSLSSISTTGIFSKNITNLDPETDYYFKAFVSYGDNIVYGSTKHFKTLIETVPSIITNLISDITETSASTGGRITSYGGIEIIEKGICWSTSPDPDLSGSHIISDSENDEFTCTITGLSPDTKYYIRAYASNSENNERTGYGQNVILKTYSGTVTDIEGNVYYTINTGEQKWMAENLKVGTYSNGEPIPLLTNNSEWKETTSGAYCYFDNNISGLDTWGAIYNAYTVLDSRNLCPSGWHVPNDFEWNDLEMHLGISEDDLLVSGGEYGTDEGGKLKQAGTTLWNEPNTGATNESSFTALPAGCRETEGTYDGTGEFGIWWTSSDENDGVILRHLVFETSTIFKWKGQYNYGVSVRCIEGSGLPEAITVSVGSVTANSAQCTGNVTSNGSSLANDRGFCYNTTGNPTIDDNTVQNNVNGTGEFTETLSGLTPGTTYYVKAYAANNEGTGYGEQLEFTTQNLP